MEIRLKMSSVRMQNLPGLPIDKELNFTQHQFPYVLCKKLGQQIGVLNKIKCQSGSTVWSTCSSKNFEYLSTLSINKYLSYKSRQRESFSM